MKTMKIDDLRHLLFAVETQEMSVRDLRNVLFMERDTDKEISKEEVAKRLNNMTRTGGLK